MYLTDLNLHGFRNLQDPQIQPGPGFNIFWGNNAQGKTNLLEAIYLLGQLKSFRSNSSDTLIKIGQEATRLTAGISISGVQHRFELTFNRSGRSGKVDGKKATTAGDMLGRLKTVLFAPEEITLVRGNPAGRRALLDRAVFQTNAGFLPLARNYQRCLKQRNRLLKQRATSAQLEPWTSGLVESGARLRQARETFLQRISPLLQECYKKICAGSEQVELGFSSRVGQTSEQLMAELERVASREIHYQQTLAGPHRDDLQFRIAGRPLKAYGSQGQQRSFLLAFKAAQVIDLKQQTGQSPVLLLDDLTSELDEKRRNAFFDFLLEHSGQVFLTTTDIRFLRERGLKPARYFQIEDGRIYPDYDE